MRALRRVVRTLRKESPPPFLRPKISCALSVARSAQGISASKGLLRRDKDAHSWRACHSAMKLF